MVDSVSLCRLFFEGSFLPFPPRRPTRTAQWLLRWRSPRAAGEARRRMRRAREVVNQRQGLHPSQLLSANSPTQNVFFCPWEKKG